MHKVMGALLSGQVEEHHLDCNIDLQQESLSHLRILITLTEKQNIFSVIS